MDNDTFRFLENEDEVEVDEADDDRDKLDGRSTPCAKAAMASNFRS